MNDVQILGPGGTPARAPQGDACPRCGAGKSKRVQSVAFGRKPIDVCVECGFEFPGEDR